MKRILTGVVGALATLLAASLAQAANVWLETPETETSPAVIRVGRFIEGDSGALAGVSEHAKRATVFFHSLGGWVPDAVNMARLIHERGYNTAVGNHQFCYSACAIAWLGGKQRFLGIPAAVGFHRPFHANGEWLSTREEGNLAAFLHQFGITDSVAAKLFTPGRPSRNTIMVFVRNNIDGNHLGIELTRIQIPKFVPLP
jgi:hypothetical protein